MVKNLSASVGDVGSIPGSGRSPGEGNGNPLQYSCLGNSMDRGAWQATVDGVSKSWTKLSMHTYTINGINFSVFLVSKISSVPFYVSISSIPIMNILYLS